MSLWISMKVLAVVNPIFVEILGSYLLSAAEEMSAAMFRSAYSPAIRDRHDCSSAILTLDGETIAQASDIPIHLGALVGVVSDAVGNYGIDRLREGDVLLANDPYLGSSTHLNDISALAPIHVNGRLVAFASVTAHHSDVGGTHPGSESMDAANIFQEGIRLPCLLAYRDGSPQKEILDLIVLNSRTPAERAGDLRAQIGAVLKGTQRFVQLVDKYSLDRVQEGMAILLDHTEARFRTMLAPLADGTFTAVEELDAARDTGAPVRIQVRIEKRRDQIRLDFSGTTPQLPEGRNVSYGGLLATVHYALRSLVDPAMPANDGFFRAVEVEAPKGSLINAAPPFPVSSRVSTCQHIAGVIMKALAPGWPDRVIAGCDGRRKVIFSGPDPRSGRLFVYHESNAGGLGAHSSGDGLDGTMAHVIQILNMPVEALELAYPLAVRRLELMQDSGGAGRWRGGAGVRRDYVALGDDARCTLVSEQSNKRMWGLFGGGPGGRGRFVFNPGSLDERELDSTKLAWVKLRGGDVLRVETTGGGGFGPPHERPVDVVLRDLTEERISPAAAWDLYGVKPRRLDNGAWTGQRDPLGASSVPRPTVRTEPPTTSGAPDTGRG